MRALVCTKLTTPEDLEAREVDTPEPGPGEVRIKVHAAGLNFPDVLLIQGKYQFQPQPPFSPGGEVAGVIDAVGEGVDASKVGTRVCAFALHGGMAEALVVQASAAIPLPEGIEMHVAGGFMLTYATSYYALKDRAGLKEGESVVVLGAAGGVGLAAVELAKKLGAKVIAAASTAEKLELARAYGADETIDYTKENLKDRIKALTGGQGADVVYDPVGGSYSEAALRATGWNGRFLVVGFAAGDIPKIPLNLTLLKSCQIVGVFWGAHTAREPELHQQNAAQLLAWLAAGELKPHIDARYPLAEGGKAIRAMMDRAVRGKIVLDV